MTYGINDRRPRLWLEGTIDFRFLTSDMRVARFYNDKEVPHGGKFSFSKGKVKFKAGGHTCREGSTGDFYNMVRAIRVAGRLRKIREKHKKYLNRKWRPSVVKLCFSSNQGRESCEEITKIADVLVANSFVLLFAKSDIIPIAGNAGDFTYKHKEPHTNHYSYNVLSEACVFHPAFISFALGALRTALAIHTSGHGKTFLKMVNEARVQRAINENDLRAARRTYKDIKPFLSKMRVNNYGNYDDYSPLTAGNLRVFEKILDKGGIEGLRMANLQKNWGLRKKHGRWSGGWFDTERRRNSSRSRNSRTLPELAKNKSEDKPTTLTPYEIEFNYQLRQYNAYYA